ncbi:60S ribosomal protein L36a-like [Herpailurus yagouaroundi]|uniref:60S ribosomal protein L36a-like n=1 Tax=Herpailurus yagouaroundi TaxID=1608482 RepID=UPI001AD77297|nr:60S ribosomal protein L36a-like [Puma yagouaroundi]
MVNIPKTCWTLCKKCGKYQQHKVTQYKKGNNTLYAQRKQHYDRKQNGYSERIKPIFWKKTKTTKRVMLRIDCIEPNYRCMKMLAIKRCKHLELRGHKKRKGHMIHF